MSASEILTNENYKKYEDLSVFSTKQFLFGCIYGAMATENLREL